MEGEKVTKWGEDFFVLFVFSLCLGVCVCVFAFCFVVFFVVLLVFFFFFFFFFFFLLSHFSKPLKFVLGLPKWKSIERKKNISRQEKNDDFAPSEKYSPYAPAM